MQRISSAHIQIHTQHKYIVYPQSTHGRTDWQTDGQMDITLHIPYIVYIPSVHTIAYIHSIHTECNT